VTGFEDPALELNGREESGMKSEAKTLVLVSPATAESNNGNWHTAHRWAKFLSSHCDTALLKEWPENPTTHGSFLRHAEPAALIALHARRSAPSIKAWAGAYPGKPLIVVLTGTDLYRDIHTDADAQRSLALASRLVVLQDSGLAALPHAWQGNAQVIYQSAPALKPAHKSHHTFCAVMVGHLRDEKDPLTFMKTALAGFPAAVRFDQIGAALEPRFAQAASATARHTPRYRWLGDLPRAATRQHIKRAHVLVNCSWMEGGSQAILEAVQSGTPVLASRISGNIGMLGETYAGYFAVGDDAGLAALVRRCAREPDFLALLQKHCSQRAHLFDPQEEKRHVINLALDAGIAARRP